VKTHVGRVLAKVGARDRIQAVILAYDLGLARPNSPDQ
jgi:DNA-binding NarL/FixJ family response regulator